VLYQQNTGGFNYIQNHPFFSACPSLRSCYWKTPRFRLTQIKVLGFNEDYSLYKTLVFRRLFWHWRESIFFVLPDFHVIDRVPDHIEADNATAIVVRTKWTYEPWWQRLCSSAWALRITIAY
jgi:hypothetical protein